MLEFLRMSNKTKFNLTILYICRYILCTEHRKKNLPRAKYNSLSIHSNYAVNKKVITFVNEES